MSKSIVTMIGGIGDILLDFSGLDNISNLFDNNIDCRVFTHFKDAENLLLSFNFDKTFYFYKDQDEFQKLTPILKEIMNSPEYIGDVEIYNTTIYPDIQIPIELNDLDVVYDTHELESNRYVIIHPFGSFFANNFIQNKLKRQSKNIDRLFLIKVCGYLSNKNIKPIILCTPDEKQFLSGINPNLIVTSDNIWKSFALVDNSLFVIASDSAIKSYSAIIKKPSIVFVGDYEDKIRDEKFITPYELGDTYFKVIRFNQFDQKTFDKTKEILDGWT
jgi:ADP-heptose:LPS heptosyltransferase